MTITRAKFMKAQPALPLVFAADFASENFHLGTSNQHALEILQKALSQPLGFVIIHGAEGCGKTHLANALARRLGERLHSADDSAQQFVEQRRFLIDNWHSLIDDQDLQELWVHRINRLQALQHGHLIVFSRSLPATWQKASQLQDFLSRINGLFTFAEILPPDDKLLEKMLHKLAADRQFHLTPAQIAYCLMRMPRSFHAASRLMDLIDHVSLSQQRKVTRTTLRLALQSLDLYEDGT